jgi:hypothetical protein
MKWTVILYTLVTTALFMLIPMLLFLISPCRTTSSEEADFFLLPTFNRSANEFKTVVEAVEATHNITLHRRGMRDHIYPGLFNPADPCQDKDWSDTAKAIAYRTLKVLGEIYTWFFSFSSRQGPHCDIFNLENMIAMPYVSDPHNLSGDIHRPRKYLSLFMGNKDPWYRATIAEQCDNAIDCYYPNKTRGELLVQQRYDMYINSTFFFCPAGDTPTREPQDKHAP